MWQLIKNIVSWAAFAALVYFSFTVPLGTKTLWQHLSALVESDAGQDLVDGVKQKTKEVMRPIDSSGDITSANTTDEGSAGGTGESFTQRERRAIKKIIRERRQAHGSRQAPEGRQRNHHLTPASI